MENQLFANLSRQEVCRRMSVYCQKAADETPSGEACERMQCASNRFRQEADELAIADMSITRLWSKKPR